MFVNLFLKKIYMPFCSRNIQSHLSCGYCKANIPQQPVRVTQYYCIGPKMKLIWQPSTELWRFQPATVYV